MAKPYAIGTRVEWTQHTDGKRIRGTVREVSTCEEGEPWYSVRQDETGVPWILKHKNVSVVSDEQPTGGSTMGKKASSKKKNGKAKAPKAEAPAADEKRETTAEAPEMKVQRYNRRLEVAMTAPEIASAADLAAYFQQEASDLEEEHESKNETAKNDAKSRQTDIDSKLAQMREQLGLVRRKTKTTHVGVEDRFMYRTGNVETFRLDTVPPEKIFERAMSAAERSEQLGLPAINPPKTDDAPPSSQVPPSSDDEPSPPTSRGAESRAEA